MTENNKSWAIERLEYLQAESNYFTLREKENLKISYIENLLERIITDSILASPALIKKMDEVIKYLKIRKIQRLQSSISLSRATDQLIIFVRKHHKLIPQGYYRRKYSLYGLCFAPVLGVGIGLTLKHIAIGLPLGLPLGLGLGGIIGLLMDEKAVKNKRVL